MSNPPKLADKFLTWFCAEELLDEIQGDLHEYFHSLDKNPWKKSLLYWFHVFHFLRPFAFRKKFPAPYNNNNFMLKSHIRVSLRVLQKNRLFSFINIIGLAISMSIGILMMLFLSEVYSFDDFHAYKNEIYRVTTTRIQGSSDETSYLTTASGYMADQLKSQVHGINDIVVMRSEKVSTDLKTEKKAIEVDGFQVSATFFDIFSFKLTAGNRATALTDPNGIVLTESTAQKLFSDQDPLGQSVSLDLSSIPSTWIVTGVMEDPPINSHMQFDVLFAMGSLSSSRENTVTGSTGDPTTTGDYYVYVLLDSLTSPEVIESSMAKVIAEYNVLSDSPISHHLQPMSTFVTSETYSNLIGPSFPRQRVHVMIGLTLLILLSACFNYSNLSLARVLKRSKEVGIRKVTGANSSNVFFQFLIEAIILSLLAFIVGFGLFFFVRPKFLSIQEIALQGMDIFRLEIELVHIVYFSLFTVTLGILAGFLPALFFVKLTAKELIKDVSKTRFFPGLNLRRTMIIFQIATSISLVTASVLVYNQYRFSLSYHLGYETENIINIPVKSDYIDILKHNYAQVSEVIQVSKSSLVIGIGGDGLSGAMTRVAGMKKPNPTLIGYIDESFLDLHEFDLLAGSTFKNPLMAGGNPGYIIVNEGLLTELGLGTPFEAVGKTMELNGSQVKILGVVKDFIEIGLTKKLFKSFAFIYPNQNDQFSTLSVKFESENLLAFIEKLEKEYSAFDLAHPFEFHFYSDQIANNYRHQKLIYILVTGLSFVAISISMLGLLGMAVFNAESRTKEISIRKVLGARLASLVLLLTRNFLASVIISGLIAIPLTFYIVDRLVLNEFMYRHKIGWEIISGLFVVLILGMLIVGWQIRSVARQNPADLLKTE